MCKACLRHRVNLQKMSGGWPSMLLCRESPILHTSEWVTDHSYCFPLHWHVTVSLICIRLFLSLFLGALHNERGMWPKWKLWAIPGATALTPLKSHGINLAPLEMPQPSCHMFTKFSSDISGIEEVWLTWILAVPHDQVKPWGAVKVMLHKPIA